MKHTSLLYPVALLCFVLFARCSKDGSATPVNEEPLVTAVGTPTDAPTTATIDASGGVVTSSDGKMQLTIPAGAVNTPTLFSIQPITNPCPGGFENAYRLTPEGLTFTQPLVVTFFYADTAVANEKYLGIAFQGNDHTWYAPKEITRNDSENKISFASRHFSDWSLFERISIKPRNSIVKINEHVNLTVVLTGEPRDTTDNNGVEHTRLNLNPTFASDWHVNGSNGNAMNGYIVKQGEDKATYSAPSAVPSHNPVLVSAKLKNVSFQLDGVTYTNPEITATVRVFKKEYRFVVEFTSSRTLHPVGNNWFTETDHGSMAVLVKDDSVTVSALQNADAEITPAFLYDDVSECTTSVVTTGDGPYHISPNVFFSGFYFAHDTSVYIGIGSQSASTTHLPTFQIVCSGSNNVMGGEETIAFPGAFSFKAYKNYQEFITVIPGGGAFPDGFLKTAVIKQN